MKDRSRYLVQYGVPGFILIAAVIAAAILIETRPEPKRAQATQRGVLVETIEVQEESHQLNVRAQGTVIPAREVVVRPQVSGKVVALHEELRPGGLINSGERLFQIERADFEIAVRERKTALEEAKAKLALEKGRQKVAHREWELYRDQLSGMSSNSSLALREPQLQSARAAVEAAKARLKRSRLDLDRTTVKAPFEAFVQKESVDLGQIVDPQSGAVTLIGTDAFWVRASIPVDKLGYVKVRGLNAAEGSNAVIRYDRGEGTSTWQGEVIELLTDLDSAGRMARLLIEVPDPFGLEAASDNPEPEMENGAHVGAHVPKGPLLVDSYVAVEVRGERQEQLIELPRKAVRNGDEAFVYTAEERLDIRELEIRWRREETVLVATGLEGGEQVVTTRIATPIRGMKLRRPKAFGAGESGGTKVGKGDEDG